MPVIYIQDEKTGEKWKALRHTGNNPGPNGRDPVALGTINGKPVQFCLGRNNGGVRVNFEYKHDFPQDVPNEQDVPKDMWWHITQNDQAKRNGEKPNFYPKIIRAKRQDTDLNFVVIE